MHYFLGEKMAKISLKIIVQSENYKAILDDLAVNLFNAQSAKALEHCEGFDIDHGCNDIRAYYNPSVSALSFICRYERDVQSLTDKIMAYAIANELETR